MQPDFVISDWQNATETASSFDNVTESAARNVSNNYFEILALTMRQALGATELVIVKTDDGFDPANPMLLVKGMFFKQQCWQHADNESDISNSAVSLAPLVEST